MFSTTSWSSNQDTDWARSAKGNHWRRFNGVPLVVGSKKNGGYWVRVGDGFIQGNHESLPQAKGAAELAYETGKVFGSGW